MSRREEEWINWFIDAIEANRVVDPPSEEEQEITRALAFVLALRLRENPASAEEFSGAIDAGCQLLDQFSRELDANPLQEIAYLGRSR